MSNNFEIFERNAEKADKLQAEHGLFQSYRDLYAWEELTEDEVVGLQKYWNATHPKYTGIEEIDSKLMEDFEKNTLLGISMNPNSRIPRRRSFMKAVALT